MNCFSISVLFILLSLVSLVRAGVLPQLQDLNIYYGGNKNSTLDIYYNKNTEKLKPVVVFIHGGSWNSGDKYQYTSVGSFLMENDYIAVIPNYILYPDGKMDDMVQDVYQSIQWTYKNISKYGGDKKRIILSGHSAGAHLCMLTVVKSSLRLINNKKLLKPLPKLEKLVLLNGPYDFNDYNPTKIKGLGSIVAGLHFSSFFVSPTNILKYKKRITLPTTKINLLACEDDELVPQTSADNLIKQIQRASPTTHINYHLDTGHGYDHARIIMGIINDEPEIKKLFLDRISQ